MTPEAKIKIEAAILLIRDEVREEISRKCTDAKYLRDQDLTEFERGWNAACRELCNAIFNDCSVIWPNT